MDLIGGMMMIILKERERVDKMECCAKSLLNNMILQ